VRRLTATMQILPIGLPLRWETSRPYSEQCFSAAQKAGSGERKPGRARRRSDYSSIAASTNPAGSAQNSRMTLKWSVCSTVTGSRPYFDSRSRRALG